MNEYGCQHMGTQIKGLEIGILDKSLNLLISQSLFIYPTVINSRGKLVSERAPSAVITMSSSMRTPPRPGR